MCAVAGWEGMKNRSLVGLDARPGCLKSLDINLDAYKG